MFFLHFGFTLHFPILGCGFIANATNVPQSFSSPNWPNNYSVSTDCTWAFTTQNPDERIQIIFESFSTEFCCDLVTVSTCIT